MNQDQLDIRTLDIAEAYELFTTMNDESKAYETIYKKARFGIKHRFDIYEVS